MKYKYKVELTSSKSVKEFTEVAKSVEGEVRLIGKDENGSNWDLSAKSLLCSLIVGSKLQEERDHNAHTVDWNTLWVVSDEDIYSVIKDFVVAGDTYSIHS